MNRWSRVAVYAGVLVVSLQMLLQGWAELPVPFTNNVKTTENPVSSKNHAIEKPLILMLTPASKITEPTQAKKSFSMLAAQPDSQQAIETSQAKQPVVDQSWRPHPATSKNPDYLPQPVVKTPVQSSAPQQAADNPEKPFSLQTQKGSFAKTYLFRRLVPNTYKTYTANVKALLDSLHDTWVYLKSLNGEEPNIQRLSAFNARVRVEWLAFEKQLPPDAPTLESYKSVTVAVNELQNMATFWQGRNRVRRVYRGTLDQEYADDQVVQTRLANLKQCLEKLEDQRNLEKDLVKGLPY